MFKLQSKLTRHACGVHLHLFELNVDLTLSA